MGECTIPYNDTRSNSNLWYSLVLVAASSTFILNMVHSFLTSGARKASGIKYPTTYASDEVAAKDQKAYKFNCGMSASLQSPPLSTLASC